MDVLNALEFKDATVLTNWELDTYPRLANPVNELKSSDVFPADVLRL
jgi:hypothetical protein